jgi:hypothetical protein
MHYTAGDGGTANAAQINLRFVDPPHELLDFGGGIRSAFRGRAPQPLQIRGDPNGRASSVRSGARCAPNARGTSRSSGRCWRARWPGFAAILRAPVTTGCLGPWSLRRWFDIRHPRFVGPLGAIFAQGLRDAARSRAGRCFETPATTDSDHDQIQRFHIEPRGRSDVRFPPSLTKSPLLRQRVTNRLTELMLTPQSSAVCSWVWPDSIA